MGLKVELVYFEGCPHVVEARTRLRSALGEAGSSIGWVEWDTELPDTPEGYRKYGSPTILVDGRDVGGGAEGGGHSCVVGGAPSVAQIVAAIRERAR